MRSPLGRAFITVTFRGFRAILGDQVIRRPTVARQYMYCQCYRETYLRGGGGWRTGGTLRER